MDNSIRERLAELEHDQWATWARNILHELRAVTITHWSSCTCAVCLRVLRWTKLLVPYSQLSEEQKDQDRAWADKVIRIIEGR